MRSTVLAFSALLLLASSAALARTVPSAEALMGKARAKATSEHKTIFVMFDASW